MKSKDKNKEKPNGVKAEVWSLIVCDGALDMAHGMGRRISELYIPTSGIVINSVDGRVCCFRDNGDRYKKSSKFMTNNANPVLKGVVYVPYGIFLSAATILEASDVLKTKVDEISELCKIKTKKKKKK